MNSVPVDEYVLAASLDDFWRTPATIKSRFRIKGNMELVTRAASPGRGRVDRAALHRDRRAALSQARPRAGDGA
jgi:hypothetical protein